jgi:hypothetical protein
MRRAAPVYLMIVAVCGCSIMHPPIHPGITDPNPDLVIREYPATATQMAKIMADVMASDPILDNVSMTPAGGREYRSFTKAEREVLGASKLTLANTLANDVNWNVQARSKNGHPVAVAIRLKGEASSEISVLYGARGDNELSKDLLDKAQTVLANTVKDSAVTKTAGSKTVAGKALTP